MITRFQIIQPHPLIKDYIERIFILESTDRMPSADLKLIVPNACPKLVFPFKNGLIGKSAQWQHLTKENKISIIGISDIPTSVDYCNNAPAGNITVEFKPLGAYRFFNFSWGDIKNQIWNYADITQDTATALEAQLMDVETIEKKIQIIQSFLIRQLTPRKNDLIFDYCVKRITASHGKVSIKELEKYTGYSTRWLNMKFSEKIGISPKNLASIIRFQKYYKALVTNTEKFFLQKDFYNYYHDQSHFIKDFKRFTGYPPVFLAQSSNDYDKFFYKE